MNRPRWALSFAAVLCALHGCAAEEPVAEPELRPVRTVEVRPGGETTPIVFAGVARAGVESNLSFRVAGTVVGLPVAVGDEVARGQVLGRLDPVDYELAVQEAAAALAQAEAGLRRAIADYGRLRALYENNNAAKSDLDAARAAFESGEAQVEAAKKRQAQAQQQLDYTVLRAPVTGAVAVVEVEVNETVAAGKTVFRLTSGEAPEIEVGVSEVTIARIRPAMPVTVDFDALPGQSFQGTVTEVGVASSAGRSTFPVTVRLSDESAGVRSGMAAEVTFEVASGSNGPSVAVPPLAVGEDREGRYVFVVEDLGDSRGVVRRHPVTVGQFTPRGIEILDGLTAGDRVVTAGVRRLGDGMEVRYEPDARSPWM